MATWQIDNAHTSVTFTVRHMMITNVRGSFGTVEGVIHYDPATPNAASVEAKIETASINTGVTDRDNHLRSADFFNAAVNPLITFTSTSVNLTSENEGTITGDLTMAGVTKPITLKVEYLGVNKNPWGKNVVGFAAEGTVNREDFGLTWNQALETGGVLVGKEIKLALDVQAVLVEETVTA